MPECRLSATLNFHLSSVVRRNDKLSSLHDKRVLSTFLLELVYVGGEMVPSKEGQAWMEERQ